MKKSVILTIASVFVCIGVIAGFFVLPNLNGLLSDESLSITEMSMAIGEGSWVSMNVTNNRNNTVTITEFIVNNVRQSPVYPQLPITLPSKGSVIINATSAVILDEKTYWIGVTTSNGKSFSEMTQTSTTA
jgi:hypothetical protein